MKTLTLNKEQKEVLKFSMESVTPQSVVNIKDLRLIDKLCTQLESEPEQLSFEDSDFTFLKTKFNSYSGWNPEARKLILSVSDVLENVKA